jgi:hypothetical protein
MNVTFALQLNSSPAASNGTQRIQINLGNYRICISFVVLLLVRHGAMRSIRDYVISFYSDRTPELKTGLEYTRFSCFALPVFILACSPFVAGCNKESMLLG